VVTSQHLYEIEAIADQLVILDDGKCAFAGRLDDLARNASRVVIEISLKAAKSDVAECMKDFGLEGIEETIEGYILVLPNGTSHEALFTTMRRRFGDELYSYRDISRSTRSLMCETPALAGLLASNPEAKHVDAPVHV
jgi:ABC-type multidrug transport system ATPase subunit